MAAVHSSQEANFLKKPKLMQSTLAVQFEMADQIFERIKQKFGHTPVFRLPDIQTPMDIAALIWKKEDFFPSMLIEPDSIKVLTQKIRELQFEFFDTWFARYAMIL